MRSMGERFTRPPAGSLDYYEDLNEDFDRRGNHNHNSNRVTVSDRTKGFVVSTLVALNVVATVAMFAQWRSAERETRMLEYYVMELDGKLMAGGIIKPPESWSAKKRGEGK